MIKRRKKAAPVRRRRSMGAVNTFRTSKAAVNPLMNIALGAAGAIAGSMLGAKVLPNLDPKIKGAAWIALGYIIPNYLLKNANGAAIGTGVGISGALILGKSFGLISGIPVISGMHEAPMISGYNRARMLNGMNDANNVQSEPNPDQTVNRFLMMSAR